METTNKVWLKTDIEIMKSLLADEAKNAAMLNDMNNTIKQLRAKSSFRLALINKLIDNNIES
jgi:hypothetical protein